MNFKRKRPKNRRAGCLLCKNWKMSHSKGSWGKKQDKIDIVKYKEELKDRRD